MTLIFQIKILQTIKTLRQALQLKYKGHTTMSEEFSKLSIKSKSVTSSQSMMWVIPQSRLDKQCPFLEKEYPFFTTDFSMLHYSVKDLELKLKLILDRKEDSVQLSLSCFNDNVMFDKKEFRHMEKRFSVEKKGFQRLRE